MSLPIFEHPHRPGFWRAARDRMLAHHGLPTSTAATEGAEGGVGRRRRRRKIVYVDRQSTDRRLADADHEGLVRVVRALEAQGDVEFVWAKWEEMGPVEQVGVVADAWVSVGAQSAVECGRLCGESGSEAGMGTGPCARCRGHRAIAFDDGDGATELTCADDDWRAREWVDA
jgi:hypothetical protein